MSSDSEREYYHIRREEFKDDFLSCTICFEPYGDDERKPKTLPCSHSFCKDCLNNHIQNHAEFECPTCRRETTAPPNGADGFSNNLTVQGLLDYFKTKKRVKEESLIPCEKCKQGGQDAAIDYCFDCGTFLCQLCSDEHTKSEELDQHKIIGRTELNIQGEDIRRSLIFRSRKCNVEKSHEYITHFCDGPQCQVPICAKCYPHHHGDDDLHIQINLQDATKKYTPLVKGYLEVAETRKKHLDEQLTEVGDILMELDGKKQVLHQYLEEASVETDQRQAITQKFEEQHEKIWQKLQVAKGDCKRLHAYTKVISRDAQAALQNEMYLLRKAKDIDKLSKEVDVEQRALPDAGPRKVIELEQKALDNFLERVRIHLNAGDVRENADAPDTETEGEGEVPEEIGPVQPPGVIEQTTPEGTSFGVRYFRLISGAFALLSILVAFAYMNLGFLGYPTSDVTFNVTWVVTLCNASVNDDCISTIKPTLIASQLINTDRQHDPLEMNFTITYQDGDIQKSNVVKSQNNTYTVKFRPMKEGKYNMNMNVTNFPIEAYSLDFIVTDTRNRPIAKFGRRGKGENNFNEPRDIILTSTNNLLVADYKNKRIKIFNDEGALKSQFTMYDMPISAAVLPNGSVIVVQDDKKDIPIYHEGKRIGKLTHPGFSYPYGITVNQKGHLLVADRWANRVFVFQENGKFLREIGSEGDLEFPSFVATGNNGDIVVGDGPGGVKVFSQDGDLISNISTLRDNKNVRINGVGINKDKRIIAVDVASTPHRMFVLNYAGDIIRSIPSQYDKLNDPHGVAVTNDGHVFVADSGNHCIKKYRYKL
ncbi:E3 ubiquitin-protein ligase TRIM71-like [Glandiceps talaboti]